MEIKKNISCILKIYMEVFLDETRYWDSLKNIVGVEDLRR